MSEVNPDMVTQETRDIPVKEPNPSNELTSETIAQQTLETPSKERPPTYVKLAMRNMVRKKGTSLKHFFLTTTALLAFFIGVSYLTR